MSAPQLPATLVECLKSEDEKVRIAGVLEMLWQAEAKARALCLGLCQYRSIVQNVAAPDSDVLRDICALFGLSKEQCAYLIDVQKSLVVYVQQSEAVEEKTEPATIGVPLIH